MVGNQTASELYDIYGVWYVPFWQTQPFIIAMYCLAASLSVFIIYLLVRMFLKRAKKVTPWQWAQRELDLLWEKRGFTREDSKQFYFRLTEIIKSYLEKRYDYNARSATDIELLTYLRDHDFAPELIDDLARIINGSQEIKFANLDAIPEQVQRDFALSKSFIAKTIPQKKTA